MVVITIIAILALAGIAIYSNVQKSARDSRRKADIDAISKALEVHYDGNAGSYPVLADTWFTGGAIPKDPKGASYIGIPGAGATTWNVCADLEGMGTSAGGGTEQDYCKKNAQ